MGLGVNARAQRTEMARAVEGGQLIPYYQPKIDLKSGLSAGFEALARWQDPSRGLLPPSAFPVALNDRVVTPMLTKSILASVVKNYSSWRSRGLYPGRISVNVTSHDLQVPSFASEILSLLDKWSLGARDLILEVVETTMLGEPDGQLYKTLIDLRSHGMLVALDDFGIGFGSIRHLRTWPIDRIKIDKIFVAECLHNPKDQSILRAIITPAHDLGLGVVADGVEELSQAALLASYGCDFAQGYLFFKPLSAADAGAFLESQHGTSRAYLSPKFRPTFVRDESQLCLAPSLDNLE
jgi:EAL domain-containing protein (putative c-di-GMP-specific phosphodiesterase class I)